MRIIATLALSGLLLAQQQPPASQGPGQGQGAGQGQGRGRGGGFRQPDPIDFDAHEGWTSLFDGKSLNGWSGDGNWKIEEGAINPDSLDRPTTPVVVQSVEVL